MVRRIWQDTGTASVSHNIDMDFNVAWSPNGESVAFLSNRDGWRHLHVTEIGSTEVRRLTAGEYEVMWAGWSPDGGHVTFVANRDDPHQRQPWIVSASGGDARRLYDGPGIATDGWTRRSWPVPVWSPAGSLLVFPFNSPEDPYQIRLASPTAGGAGVQVYSALEEGLRGVELPRMRSVSFRSRDGTSVPGMLLLPADFDESRRHPALVFMYGGWGQMATLGWTAGFRPRMFAYLTGRGYVLLVADPRGSEGYGDAHAKGLYLEGGGKQSEDLLAAAEYLA